MKTSKNGLEFVARWEGIVLNPYMDVASLWTIGVGHLIKPTDSFSSITNAQVKDLLATKDKNHPVAKIQIPRDEAMDILSKDIASIEYALSNAIQVPLNQNQYDALISFGFNCGPGVFRTSGACKAILENKFAEVPEKLLDWSKARINGVLKVNRGLYNRRVAEGELFTRVPAPAVPTTTLVSWTPEIIVHIQTKLKALGLYPGLVDGISGPATRKAIEEFSKKYNIKSGGDSRSGVSSEWMSTLNSV